MRRAVHASGGPLRECGSALCPSSRSARWTCSAPRAAAPREGRSAGCPRASRPRESQPPPGHARHDARRPDRRLRRDRSGGAPPETPDLDAPGRSAAPSSSAPCAVTPLTLPAHCTMMTGLLPGAHGVRDNGGYRLAAERRDAGRGVRRRRLRAPAASSRPTCSTASGGSRRGSTLLRRLRPREPRSRSAWGRSSAAATRPCGGRRSGSAGSRARALLRLGPPLRSAHALRAAGAVPTSRYPGEPYDAEIAWTDRLVGGLLERARAARAAPSGPSSRSSATTARAWASTARPGTATSSTSRRRHCAAARRRPYPALAGAHRARRRSARPTWRRRCSSSPGVAGRARARAGAEPGAAARRRRRPARAARAATARRSSPRFHYGWAELRALRDGRWHFIEAPRAELYDLEADPAESVNLADRERRVVRELRAALAGDRRRRTPPAAGTAPVEEDEETLRALAALGYVGGQAADSRQVVARAARSEGPARRLQRDQPRARPRPRRGAGRGDRRCSSEVLADGSGSRGRLVHARQRLLPAARLGGRRAQLPRDARAATRARLGDDRARRHVRGARADRRRRARLPALPRVATRTTRRSCTGWRRCCSTPAATPRRRAAFRRTLAVEPHTARAEVGLAVVAFRRRDFAAAHAALDRALAIDAEGEVDARYNRALLHEAEGRTAEAETRLPRRDRATTPTRYKALFNLGRLLERRGDAAGALAADRAAVAAQPEFALGRLILARALLGASDLAGAEREAQEGLAPRARRRPCAARSLRPRRRLLAPGPGRRRRARGPTRPRARGPPRQRRTDARGTRLRPLRNAGTGRF